MVSKVFKVLSGSICGALLFSHLIVSVSFADEADFDTIDTPRFTLHVEKQTNETRLSKTPADLAVSALSMLDSIDKELTRILDYQPEEKVILRFLTREEFTRQTSAPSWTNAMYFRGEITIPLEEDEDQQMDLDELRRALRHEYVHALVAEISSFRCPAWLDEGLAQIIEGEPNSLLGPALREWISSNEAMPLRWLRNGFTTLSNKLVPAAYAQSLFATRTLLNSLGFNSIKKYLSYLGEGKSDNAAFRLAFNRDQEQFEQQLTSQIERWSVSTQVHP